MEPKSMVSRRSFMKTVTLAIGGLISAALGIPAIAFILGPALRKNEDENRIRLGSTSKVELGTPTLFKAKITEQTGWIEENKEVDAYVITEDAREYVALSNICTHLGCRVRWVANKDQFFCPCHNGVFAKDGTVVSGPPPRPLNRYEIEIVQDEIYIKVG